MYGDDTRHIGPLTITIEQDDDAGYWSPIEDPDASCCVIVNHRDYSGYTNVDPTDYGIVTAYGGTYLVPPHGDIDYDAPEPSVADIAKHLQKHYGAEVMLVKAYIHSGITVSADPMVYGRYPDQQWDVTHGFALAFLTADQIRTAFNCKRVTKKRRAEAREAIQASIKAWDMLLRGDVWDYRIEDADGDIIDSCGGMYGYDHCVTEAETIAREWIAENIVDPRTWVGEIRENIPAVVKTQPKGPEASFDQQIIRLDDGLGRTIATGRIIRDRSVRPHWFAIADADEQDREIVLCERGTRDACESAIRDHFLAVCLGEAADYFGRFATHADEEAA